MDIIEIIQQVKEGKQEALTVLKDLKDFKKYIDAELKEIELIALDEAKDYEKKFELNGFKFEKRNGRATYSYKNIPEWNEVNERLKDIEAKYKSVYSQYQRGVTAVDENTGEVLQAPEVTYSKDVLIVK